ncbi:MAG: hypothetical protein N3D82_01960 [Ignisphaera sp.]|nr:hypothetical protein [Ignisphaera sp.]MCX8167785.1 hypothetical protein [Ignisphaera sp.]MDW8085228.1 hypothetical protein [Ignisphaera sp.]
MLNNKAIKRSEKIRILKILKALNSFYSLRELEEMLSIPFQSLWRYVNFIGVPSDEIANEIIEKISKLRIIESTLVKMAKSSNSNYYNLIKNTGFIELFALAVDEKLKKIDTDVDYVFALSEEGIPIATSLALELGTEICFPLVNRNIQEDVAKIIWYYSHSEKEYKYMLIPRECIHRDKKVYVVDIFMEDIERVKSVTTLMRMNGVEILGFSTIYISKDCLKILEEYNTGVLYYLHVIQ